MSEREPGRGESEEEIILGSEIVEPEVEIKVEKQEFPPFLVGHDSIASELHSWRNEDNLFINQEKRAGGVFDGLGGSKYSEHASRMASELLGKYMEEFDDSNIDLNKCMEEMKRKIQEVHEILKVFNKEQNMDVGTTASVVKIVDFKNTRQALIANVGDSRVYKLAGGKLSKLTIDDSFVSAIYPYKDKLEEFEERMDNCTNINQFPQEERQYFFRRQDMTQCLGKDDILVNFSIERLLPGDKILIVSDGISDNLTTQEIEDCLKEPTKDFNEATEKLVDKALARSRDKTHLREKPDDMTAVLMG